MSSITNVLVSIFQFGGRISEILDFALQGTLELFTSQPIVGELRGVLREKFHWPAERVDYATGTDSAGSSSPESL